MIDNTGKLQLVSRRLCNWLFWHAFLSPDTYLLHRHYINSSSKTQDKCVDFASTLAFTNAFTFPAF